MATDHESLMKLAIREAAKARDEGNPGFGAILVENGEVIARGRNLFVTTSDPTAHAETMAIRNASAATGRGEFANCTLYTTAEPCPMCLASILVSGVGTLVIGADRSPSDRRWGPYTPEKLIDLTNHADRIEVVKGILSGECAEVRDRA